MATLKAGSLVPAAPSPTPSNTSANGAKRKRVEEDRRVVYSQPAETNVRNHDLTQFTYAVQFLSDRPEQWFTFKEIIDYLNIREGDPIRKTLRSWFNANRPTSKIEWNADLKKYRFRPKYNIRNAAELREYLQNQKSAAGLSVKELKEGWPNVHEDLRILEQRQQVLVRHNQKDMSAKTVWDNDPTLMHPIDPEFQSEWHSIIIPQGEDDLRKTLVAAGLKPSSVPRAPVSTKPKQPKKKAMRKGGKRTNVHMDHLLKDYSKMRK